MSYWIAPPQFSAGQVLSASAHLEALARSVQVLFDLHTGSQLPFTSNSWQTDRPWSWTWEGWLRHYSNRFHWEIVCWGGGTATVKVNGVTVATCGGDGRYSGIVILTGLTVGRIYPVQVTGSSFWVWQLYEELNQSFPALAAFTDGSTPSGAEWQALSTLAGMIHSELIAPRPAFVVSPGAINLYDWNGCFRHHARYLHYNLWQQAPHNQSHYPDPGGERWTQVDLYVNSVFLARFCQGDVRSPGQGWPPVVVQHAGGAGSESEFAGQIDLENPAYGLNLSRGQLYEVVTTASASTVWDWYKSARTRLLLELPASNSNLAGWTGMGAWEHGVWVRGDSGVNPVKAIRDNLVTLAAISHFNNYPCVKNRGQGFRAYRKWRWLWYTNGAGASPTLTYTLVNEEQVSLPSAYNEITGVSRWLAYDLNSVSGLYPGTLYVLADVDAVFEDVYA